MEYASITAWGTLPHPLDKHLWVDLELPKKVFMFGNKSKAPVKPCTAHSDAMTRKLIVALCDPRHVTGSTSTSCSRPSWSASS